MRRVSISKRAHSRRVIRVSSAATSGTERRTSIARSVMSPRLPIGVATTYSVPPAAPPASVTAVRQRPPPRVEVVDTGCPRRQFRDGRNLALELRLRDHRLYALHCLPIEAHLRQLVGRVAPVDHPVEETVELFIGHAHLRLIGLARP